MPHAHYDEILCVWQFRFLDVAACETPIFYLYTERSSGVVFEMASIEC